MHQETERDIDNEQQLSTAGILALFETNKEQRQHFVTDLVNRLDNGEIDPLTIHLQVKAMEDIIFQLTSTDEKKNKSFEAAKKYRSFLLEAAQKYSAKSFEFSNAKFEIKETGTKYDYSQCNDPVLSELITKQNEIDELVKNRQKLLQTAPVKGLNLLIEDTGETVTVYPPSKSSTTSIAVTLK